MSLERYKRPFMIIYPLLLLFLFFFVKSALNDSSIDVTDKEPAPKVEDVKMYDVRLTIPYLNKSYLTKMKNTDSVQDMLESVRKNGPGYFYYEKILYTDDAKICCVNDTSIDWRITYNGEDITSDMEDLRIQESGEYILEPVIRSVTPQ